MKTGEFCEQLRKKTEYVVMGRGSTNHLIRIAYLAFPWEGGMKPLPPRTPVMFEFPKDIINESEIKTFTYDKDLREPSKKDKDVLHELLAQYMNTPIIDRIGDDAYWVVDFVNEIQQHGNFDKLMGVYREYGGLK